VRVETHLAFRNLGDLKFENVSAEWGLNQKGVSFGSAFGDLNGDGNLDVVYTNYEGGVTILRNDNHSGHSINVDLRGTVSNRFGVGATVRLESALGVQVRQLVLARGYMSSSEPMLHFGLGEDTLIRRMVVTWPSGHVQTFDNLGVDRRYTVTEPSRPIPLPPDPIRAPAQFAEVAQASGLAAQTREEDVEESYLQRLIPIRLNRRGPGLAVGDVSGAGREDVVLGGTTLDPIRIFDSSGPGVFSAPIRLRSSRARGRTTGPCSFLTPAAAAVKTCSSQGGATPCPPGRRSTSRGSTSMTVTAGSSPRPTRRSRPCR
jgi:enediyne biosynthesis protein E4